MIVTPVKTRTVKVSDDLNSLLDEYLPAIPKPAIVAVSSKVVALCEGAVVPVAGTDRRELIKKEADYLLSPTDNPYGFGITIKDHALVAAAGIDSAGLDFVLWPRDPQATANNLRRHLTKTFGLAVGVIITDSHHQPMRRGTSGFAVAHSGFAALQSYIGTPDAFGDPIYFKTSSILEGLAAAAVVTMGDGGEHTPISVITDIPFVEFQARNPTAAELKILNVTPENDLFAEFYKRVPWDKQPG